MQGFNMGRYRPPSDPTTNPNTHHHRLAPGNLRKDGTQTVRFELPFAIWCHTCSPHALVAQGVRFNAVKSRVGKYHSTPIWDFKLKHTACGGEIHVRTDPQNTAYVVHSGGQARDYGEQRAQEGEGGLPILTEAERGRRREDAFAALEGRKEDGEVARGLGKRVEELYGVNERDGIDPYEANRRARRGFRRERKEKKRVEEADERLKERLGTGMEVLPETEEDARRAKLVVFERKDEGGAKSFLKPRSNASSSKVKSRESQKAALQRLVIGNTRASMDPFA